MAPLETWPLLLPLLLLKSRSLSSHEASASVSAFSRARMGAPCVGSKPREKSSYTQYTSTYNRAQLELISTVSIPPVNTSNAYAYLLDVLAQVVDRALVAVLVYALLVERVLAVRVVDLVLEVRP